MPKKAAADGGSSVFCRMTAAEKQLLEEALQKKASQNPEATYTIGRVMVVQAVRWATEVVGAQRAKEILEDDA
jgi:hypothetical protein